MKKIIIHRRLDDGLINRVYFVPDGKSESDLEKAVSEYKSSYDTLTIEEVPDCLVHAIEFLIKDRKQDKNKILEALRELQNDINDLDRSIDETCISIGRQLEIERNY